LVLAELSDHPIVVLLTAESFNRTRAAKAQHGNGIDRARLTHAKIVAGTAKLG